MLKRRPPVTGDYIAPGQLEAARGEGGMGVGTIATVLGVLAAGAIGLVAASRGGSTPRVGPVGNTHPKRKCNCGR